jgi:hypothetical protein
MGFDPDSRQNSPSGTRRRASSHRRLHSPASSPLDCFANTRNDGLAGRPASFPVFTHSPAHSHGRLASPHSKPLLTAHSPVSPLARTTRQPSRRWIASLTLAMTASPDDSPALPPSLTHKHTPQAPRNYRIDTITHYSLLPAHSSLLPAQLSIN